MSKLDPNWRLARLEQLGLLEDPFKLSADPRYLYLGHEHLAAYRQVQGIINFRRGLALITGGPGTGKSSIARRVFDVYYDEPDVDIIYIATSNFRTSMAAARNISAALEKMNISLKSRYDDQIEALKHGIATAYSAGRNIVILLDDVQLMSKNALGVIHELYNFDFDEKAAQVIAFGQEESTELFKKYPAIDSRVFIRMSIPPMTLVSALQMVLFRLRTAGRESPLIHDDAFALLYEASSGIPRDIVRLCAMATDTLLENEANMVTLEIMQEVVNRHDRA